MALGYTPGNLCDLYRETYTDNSGSAAFAVYADVWREGQRVNNNPGPTTPSQDSWGLRLRQFFLGGS